MGPPEKSHQRRRLREILRPLRPEVMADWSERIAAHLKAWLPPGTRHLAVFAALPGEPDLSTLHERLDGPSLAYPLVSEAGLTFHAVPDPSSLRRSTYGILEPDPVRHPETPLGQIEVFLCPGLGFAADGVRLGRGKGHYDRALSLARPDALRVGIGFSVQFSPSLPSDRHDQRMTHLADETGVREVHPAGMG